MGGETLTDNVKRAVLHQSLNLELRQLMQTKTTVDTYEEFRVTLRDVVLARRAWNQNSSSMDVGALHWKGKGKFEKGKGKGKDGKGKYDKGKGKGKNVKGKDGKGKSWWDSDYESSSSNWSWGSEKGQPDIRKCFSVEKLAT